jgi:hypothetical protein
MNVSDLQIKAEVGQYWFNRYDLTLHKVIKVEDVKITFEDGTSWVPPLGSAFVYLWYTGFMDLDGFISNPPMKPTSGQVWVSSDEAQNLLIVHPDQTNLPKSGTVRILSDNSHLFGLALPLLNPIHRLPTVDSVWKDVLLTQLLAIKEGRTSPEEVYEQLVKQLVPRTDQ